MNLLPALHSWQLLTRGERNTTAKRQERENTGRRKKRRAPGSEVLPVLVQDGAAATSLPGEAKLLLAAVTSAHFYFSSL